MKGGNRGGRDRESREGGKEWEGGREVQRAGDSI